MNDSDTGKRAVVAKQLRRVRGETITTVGHLVNLKIGTKHIWYLMVAII